MHSLTHLIQAADKAHKLETREIKIVEALLGHGYYPTVNEYASRRNAAKSLLSMGKRGRDIFDTMIFEAVVLNKKNKAMLRRLRNAPEKSDKVNRDMFSNSIDVKMHAKTLAQYHENCKEIIKLYQELQA